MPRATCRLQNVTASSRVFQHRHPRVGSASSGMPLRSTPALFAPVLQHAEQSGAAPGELAASRTPGQEGAYPITSVLIWEATFPLGLVFRRTITDLSGSIPVLWFEAQYGTLARELLIMTWSL